MIGGARPQAASEPESGHIGDDNSVMAIPDSPTNMPPVEELGSNLEQDDREDSDHAGHDSGDIVNADSLSGPDIDDPAQTAGLVVKEASIEHPAVSLVMAYAPFSTSLTETTLVEAISGTNARGNPLHVLDMGVPTERAPTSTTSVEQTPSLGEPKGFTSGCTGLSAFFFIFSVCLICCLKVSEHVPTYLAHFI